MRRKRCGRKETRTENCRSVWLSEPSEKMGREGRMCMRSEENDNAVLRNESVRQGSVYQYL